MLTPAELAAHCRISERTVARLPELIAPAGFVLLSSLFHVERGLALWARITRTPPQPLRCTGAADPLAACRGHSPRG